MQQIDLKMVLLCLGMTVLGGVVIWLGLRNDNSIYLIVGAANIAFFGFGTVVLLRQRYGPAPKRQPLKAQPVAAPATNISLTATERGAFERTLAVLAKHGVFAPDVPMAAQLEAAAADYGAPVTPDMPIAAVYGAPYFDATFDISRYTQNLRLQYGKVEQTPDVIASQITDIVALSQGALTVSDIEVENVGDRMIDVAFTLNGAAMAVRYEGASKYMSTVLLQRVASAYHDLDLGYRIAGITSDENLYLTRLADGALETIREELDMTATSPGNMFRMDDLAQAYEAGA